MNKIKVLVVPSDNIGGVGFYRSIQPHVQLQKQFNDDFDVTIDVDFDWKNLDELKKFNIVTILFSLQKFKAFLKDSISS